MSEKAAHLRILLSLLALVVLISNCHALSAIGRFL
jgi:hypothetical protein